MGMFAVTRVFSTLCTITGTALLALLFTEDALRRLTHARSHELYLRGATGLSGGFCMALVLLLSMLQLACCATLLASTLNTRMGSLTPSVALVGTLCAEIVVYDAHGDPHTVVKAVWATLSLTMLCLVRAQRKMRTVCFDEPVHGSQIALEFCVRRACTRLRVALVATPLFCAAAAHALLRLAYWRQAGAAVEVTRARFFTRVAFCSVLAFLAGEDRSPTLPVLFRASIAVEQLTADVYKAFRGRPLPGRKKSL